MHGTNQLFMDLPSSVDKMNQISRYHLIADCRISKKYFQLWGYEYHVNFQSNALISTPSCILSQSRWTDFNVTDRSWWFNYVFVWHDSPGWQWKADCLTITNRCTRNFRCGSLVLGCFQVLLSGSFPRPVNIPHFNHIFVIWAWNNWITGKC